MASTDVDWAAFTSVLGTARTALQTGDYLLARQYALEAKIIALALGTSVSASGTSMQIAIEAASSLVDDIEKLQIYAAMKGDRRRRINLRAGDGRGRDSGSIFHG